MQISQIENFILRTFQDVYPLETWGERSFFLNPHQKLKRGTYFCTIKTKDGDNDKASNLSRPDVFRLNIGLTKQRYSALFGDIPSRPCKGGIIEGPFDFTQKDTLLPHPIYGWMAWVCVITPSPKTFEKYTDLFHNAYQKAYALTQQKFKKEGNRP